MPVTLSLLAALAVGACSPAQHDRGPEPINEPQQSTQIEEPSEPAQTTSVTPEEPQDDGGQTTTGGEVKKDPPANPYRLFQTKDLQVAEVKIGDDKLKLWVMDTDPKRQEGMMFLKAEDFKDDQGMLFAFPTSAPRSFWMKNTLVDLDIAYIGRDKRILNILTMKAHDVTTNYPSDGPAMYTIELRSGQFKKRAIKAGDLVEIPDTVKGKY